LGDPW